MNVYKKSNKLDKVCYDIRGPVLDEATRMEEDGMRVLKLNIGNPAPFGFDAPEELIQDVIYNLPNSQGYIESKGLFSARKAIMQECQKTGIRNVEIGDIYIGNGVSELIVMAMQALLNNGDEVLVPSPDYPLWTAAATLSGGSAVHYVCDEQDDWAPDIDDIKSKITSHTKAIVVINPNNPTGAVYSRDTLQAIVDLAREHNLIILADEIYDKILYDGAKHIPLGSLSEDILTLTMNGLSKSYRAAGFRSGWMIVSGPKYRAKDLIQGLDMLSSMRLCANVPTMWAIQTALGGYQSINDLVLPTGRMGAQRDVAFEMLNAIPGISCVKPKGAIYMFPKIDIKRFNISNDEQFVLDFLRQEKVLLVHGTGFNLKTPDHFRLVFLPRVDDLERAISALERFLSTYKQI
ncbi:MAG TPA: pyridoxal phosphate-dependent aminotransferase [Pseudomonadales bacterium]|nr:pyridoxal phosphate-dependent aminotransferase [Pseudomonadales bacterium]